MSSYFNLLSFISCILVFTILLTVIFYETDTKSFTPVHIVQLLDYMSTLWHMQNLEVPYNQSHLQAYNGL